MYYIISVGINNIVKIIVARPRPFEENSIYREFWLFVGGPKESGYSFPSGHATAVAGAMTAMFILCNKKWSWVGIFPTVLMALSRVYLIAHYATDVIVATIIGVFSGIIAYLVTKLIYYVSTKYQDKKFFNFILNFDIAKKKDK